MAKTSSKSKSKSRIESELDDFTQETAPKRDVKVIVFGVWFLIVFGLMAAFLVTTNQNVDTAPPTGTTAPGSTVAGQTAAQIKSLQDQLAKDPNNAQTLIELGFAQIEARTYDKAAASLEKAAGLAPNNADAMVGLGMALQYQGRQDDALAQYEKALKANPNHDLAKARKAYFLAEVRRDYAGALKLLREVEADQPAGDIKTNLQAQISEYEKKQ